MRCCVLPILALLLAACGPAGAQRPEPRPRPEAPRPEAEPLVAVAPASAQAEILRCALDVDARELGEAGDGEPSAPIALGDGFAVAFTRTTPSGAGDLLVQRLRGDGTLEPPIVLRRGVHASRPFAIGDGERAHVLAITQDGATEAIPLDAASGGASAATPALLSHPPDDIALGQRGLVYTYRIDERRIVHRDGEADVHLPASRSWSVPREQILASGPESELVLVRHHHGVSAAAITGAQARRSPVLFRGGDDRWAEASVASGPGGFVLVRTGPAIGDLQVYLGDRQGALGEPVPIPPPATSSRPADALVRRYPRATALHGGWGLSYWDGTGPSLVRVDATGQATAEPIELRSGDERGGHTDARMVATESAIAVTWQVEPPRMQHGFPEEEPRRPGPRLAILRCAE